MFWRVVWEKCSCAENSVREKKTGNWKQCWLCWTGSWARLAGAATEGCVLWQDGRNSDTSRGYYNWDTGGLTWRGRRKKVKSKKKNKNKKQKTEKIKEPESEEKERELETKETANERKKSKKAEKSKSQKGSKSWDSRNEEKSKIKQNSRTVTINSIKAQPKLEFALFCRRKISKSVLRLMDFFLQTAVLLFFVPSHRPPHTQTSQPQSPRIACSVVAQLQLHRATVRAQTVWCRGADQ